MGIISKLFGSSSDIEKKLEDTYISFLQTTMSVSLDEAKKIVKGFLKRAKEEAAKEGTMNLPQNFGDILLEKEDTDKNIKSMLAKRRNEGVKDDDIRWWWNMHELERKMMLLVDQWGSYAYFLNLTQKGLNEEEAANNLRKTHPIFGDTDDITRTTVEDRPLPNELKDRINIYINKMTTTDPEQFKREVARFSSFNAFIRDAINKGNI